MSGKSSEEVVRIMGMFGLGVPEVDCPYCADDLPECSHLNGMYCCTRATGHSGPHVACGYISHDKRRWDDGGNWAYQEDPLS